VIGIGADLDTPAGDGGARFRKAAGLDDEPYLLCLGRVDPSKGASELAEWFGMYQLRRRRPDLKLAFVGDPADPPPPPPGVILTGVVDEAVKESALSGAVALVQPSFFESFSIVLTEAWVHRVPALVQGRSPVLAGQARRSGGALAYRGFAEFEAALDLVLGDPALRRRLGDAGRAYTERWYAWPVVLDRYEALATQVAATAATSRRLP
jgi:glycosyltransferase involved in cell wall biosynthesis